MFTKLYFKFDLFFSVSRNKKTTWSVLKNIPEYLSILICTAHKKEQN